MRNKSIWEKTPSEVNLDNFPFKTVFAIIIIILLVFLSIYQVPAGHRGVLTTFGKVDLEEKQEGIGFKIPFAQQVTKIEVRTQKVMSIADSSSKDLQDVQTEIALNYHVRPEYASELFQNIGLDYKSRIIEPAIQETVKSVSAKYTAEELVTKRSEVRINLKLQLEERLQKSFIVIDDFNIVNFQFSEEFDKAIEQKVTAEQLKLKAERDLERIKIEAEQKVTTAQAEADSIRIQNEALARNQDVLKLRWIEKWDGVTPKVIGSSSNLINIGIEE